MRGKKRREDWEYTGAAHQGISKDLVEPVAKPSFSDPRPPDLQHLYHTLICDDLLYNLAVLKHLEDMPLGVSMCGGGMGLGHLERCN